MRKNFIAFWLLSCLFSAISWGQATVQIGFGTEVPGNTLYAPIYRYSATSATTGQRSNIIYTATELSNAGIVAGTLIEAISFNKVNVANFVTPSQFRIYMANTSNTPPLSTATTWTSIQASHTQVFEDLSFNVPSAAGWVTWTVAPFLYTGGSLEIAFENTMVGNGGATDQFEWEYTAGFADYIIGVASPTGATLNGTVTNYKHRPNIQFTYVPASFCSGPPVGGTANATQSSACPNSLVGLSVSGSTIAGGFGYQWQSSTNGLVWDDISGATNSVYSAPITSTLSYRRRMICLAGPDTAYSTAVTITLESFLNCYCTSGPSLATNASIRNVTFSNVNNTSATACSQYTDYSTGDTAIVNLGLTYPISILVEDCEGTSFGTQGAAVFIDWNHDGDFDDAGEWVYDPATQSGAATVLFTGDITVPGTALTGITKMRVINRQSTVAIPACGTYTSYGETEDYMINVLPAPANEAGVLAITRPEQASCNLGQQIWVNLQNLGSDTLTSATFTLVVNGINIPVSGTWTGSVPPQSIEEVQVPVTYSFGDGDTVSVKVSLPNGQVENSIYSFNDSTGRRVYNGLSGNKTVYGAGADFSDMDAALTALYMRGVCDTVYFKIASGNYASQYTLNAYPTFNTNSLAVFESATGGANDVTFSFNGTGTANNYVFRFDAADGYMLRNITAENYGATYSRVIDVLNGSNRLLFEGNFFLGDTVGAYAATNVNRAILASTNTTVDNNIHVRANTFVGGSRSISLASEAGSLEEGIYIEGNTFRTYSYAGVYLSESKQPIVNGNAFEPKSGLTQDAFSIYVLGSILGGELSANTINSSRPGSGIVLEDADFIVVSNNFVYMSDSLPGNTVYGIEVSDVGSTSPMVVNNSISLASQNANSAGIAILDGSEVSVYNNNIGSFALAPALWVEKSYSLMASNNNNFFASPVSSILGVTYANLADHQSATGFDQASVSVSPGFNGNDLHTCEPVLNAAGMPLAEVVEDYDGDARFTMPDIGADEFLGDAAGLLAEDSLFKCPSEQVILGNVSQDGVVYQWTPSGANSQIATTNAGTYTITATSSCGVYSDTAVVVDLPTPTAGFSSTNVGLTAIFTNTSTDALSYEWSFGDGSTSTLVNPNHVYGAAGTYAVTLTVTNDCGTDSYGPIQVNAVNAGMDDSEAIGMSIYPNPATESLTLQLGQVYTADVQLSIADIHGKLVRNMVLVPGKVSLTMNIQDLSAGVYVLKINTGNTVSSIRFVKE